MTWQAPTGVAATIRSHLPTATAITVSPTRSIQGEITVDVRQVERARTKAFYKLLVDELGADVWAKRRAAFVDRIRARESEIDLRMPIEPQLFVPPEDDIDWYILVAELAYDSPYSDCAYSGKSPTICVMSTVKPAPLSKVGMGFHRGFRIVCGRLKMRFAGWSGCTRSWSFFPISECRN